VSEAIACELAAADMHYVRMPMETEVPKTAPRGTDWDAEAGARLGDLLVRRGLISPEQLDTALERHRRVGEPLGQVLLASNVISRRALYDALGELWGLPVAEVDDVDDVLARSFDPHQLAQEGWVPVRIEGGRTGAQRVVVAVAGRPSPQVAATVRAATGIPAVEQVVTTDWDVRRALRTTWRDRFVEEAVSGLAVRHPDESASRVFYPRQVFATVGAAAALGIAAVLAPQPTLTAMLASMTLLFTVFVGFKLLISAVGISVDRRLGVTDEEVAALVESELPHYTVLVPAYREANVIGTLMRNLGALDYPREKLEVLLLLEEDDPETLAAAKAAAPPDLVRFLVIPDATPKTKPKACNIGLAFARGEYVVIYDAEDRPEPDQLKKAVVAFRKGEPDLVCVQAALNYFNADENLLTRMFTLEYSSWFDDTLPGLDRHDLPIPLGGTSNHFRTEPLRELGGWDPYNVTEDADLGIRAAVRGRKVAVVDSTTFEEANMRVGNWIRQRSRWIKGYMQTSLVHSRHPVRLARSIGLKQTLAFALLIAGTPLTFLIAPVLWSFTLLSLIWPSALAGLFPHWLLVVSLVNLLVANSMMVYLGLIAVARRHLYWLTPFALLTPLYWILHSIAAYKALWQLLRNPFYWEKTVHGLTQRQGPAPLGADPQPESV
jgi:cellulose synthase/poly-beta-1,6-N-acetylglucosamine synthase-like glycosyltransferase